MIMFYIKVSCDPAAVSVSVCHSELLNFRFRSEMSGSWITLLLLLGTTDGYLNGRIARCVFNSTRPEDIQYIDSYFYNKLEFIRFDSKVGRFVGYTELGVMNAERVNKDPAELERYRHEKDRYCVHNIEIWNNNILTKSVEPYGVIHTASSGGSERVLVCSVYGFYPKHITVTWTNNNQQITTGVINSETMPDRDWTFQLHTHLEYAPRYCPTLSPGTVPLCPQVLSPTVPQVLSHTVPQVLSRFVPQVLSPTVPQVLSRSVPQILSPRYCPPLSPTVPRYCPPGTVPQVLSPRYCPPGTVSHCPPGTVPQILSPRYCPPLSPRYCPQVLSPRYCLPLSPRYCPPHTVPQVLSPTVPQVLSPRYCLPGTVP
uniref:Ig-like domain-containing protein n=1 Tax=Neogobius melanostomus TaxID=47308 RepID=A0A8C6SJ08_9GOBI